VGERTDTGGLSAALALLGVVGGARAESFAQDDLFENVDAPLPLPVKGSSGPKGGRPKGARNRSTEEWVRLFLSQHRAPLSVLGNLMSQPLGDLVDQLQAMADKHRKWRETSEGGYWTVVQIDPLAVLALQMKAAAAAAKYIHKEQPKAIEIDRPQRGMMIMGDLGGDLEQSDDALLPMARPEENQRVVEVARPQSDGAPQSEIENALQPDGLAFVDR